MANCNDSDSSKSSSQPPATTLPPQRTSTMNKLGAKKPVEVTSVTREEIEIFWRRRKMVEEEHLIAAQKAAARLRAKDLKEEDYRQFEELVRRIIAGENGAEKAKARNGGGKEEHAKVGIKDWWTKSKYAYLNQPAVKSMTGSYTYMPQKICYSYCPPAPYQMCAATSFGVF